MARLIGLGGRERTTCRRNEGLGVEDGAFYMLLHLSTVPLTALTAGTHRYKTDAIVA